MSDLIGQWICDKCGMTGTLADGIRHNCMELERVMSREDIASDVFKMITKNVSGVSYKKEFYDDINYAIADYIESKIAYARVEVANAFKNKECYYCAYKNEKLSSSDLDVDSCISNCEEGIYLGITNNESE